mmetsp:Transcript_8665/g.21345  ORF Transcript_8665/g.21345 Transcript_8665/m.21345 type:complete len:490 (+) Transcript_8665:171-1640(+)
MMRAIRSGARSARSLAGRWARGLRSSFPKRLPNMPWGAFQRLHTRAAASEAGGSGASLLARALSRRPKAAVAAGAAVLASVAVGCRTAMAKDILHDLKLKYAFDVTTLKDDMKINVNDARRILKNYYPHFIWLDMTEDKFFLPLFDAYDKDGNGWINKFQLEDMIRRFNGHSGSTSYTIIAAPGMENFANSLVDADPDRFTYFPTDWAKFPDGSDNITVGGFRPVNRIRDENILFLASFHNNDVTLSQFYVLTMLAESFPKDLTILLPFYPTATMERVAKEGTCATANTLARFFGGLPRSGRPHRVMCYDLHTLQNRFYLQGSALASLHTAFPLLLERIPSTSIDSVAFPDDGAQKRFGSYFKRSHPDLELVVCGKKRDQYDPMKRTVVVKEGSAQGKHVVIVDDMVQSGGTLYECAKVLRAEGASSVSAFVTHGIFPRNSWKRFCKGGDRAIFENFFVTNTNPQVTDQLPENECFEVLDIKELVIKDL